MSSRTGSARTAFIIAIAFGAITGCNVNMGTGVKTLGKSVIGNNTNPGVTDSDAISVTLAYRDPSNDAGTPTRVVQIQGIRALASANLVNVCGATGTNCSCNFYRNATDASPVTAGTAGISSQNNSLSCSIPGSATTGITDAQIKANPAGMYVRVQRVDDTSKNTGLISIATTLTITDVLGAGLSKQNVRGIFRYSCTRTFFEGEGVSPSSISCVAGQHLGVITSSYSFYIYKSGVDSNSPGGDSAFPSDICKRNNFLKIQCTGNTPILRYGFYKDSGEPFVVGITMTSAPEGQNLTSNYGFAALPDSAGNCPTGLVKVRPWVAQPASIIQGSLGGGQPTVPTSFINTGNTLNDTVVEQTQPANFTVNRQPNLTPCDGNGDCTTAQFGGASTAESVVYSPMTPVVCAIPPNLLSGLF